MSESCGVAIVTGGAQGLGAGICEALLKKRYKVCVADVQEEKGTQFVKELQEKYGKENVSFAVCDVSKESDFKELFDFTLKKFNQIDVVVNNAGVGNEQYPRRIVEVNLMGTVIGCQLAIQYMGKSHGGKGGMVINVASVLGFLPLDGSPVYAATKHGVIGLTRSYSMPYHLEKDGVVFAALCPAFTDTSMRHGHQYTLRPDFDNFAAHEGQLMTPEFVAQGVLKLLEDRISGSALMVTKRERFTYIDLPEEYRNIKTILET